MDLWTKDLRMSRPGRPLTARPIALTRRERAFTLIELLTVISIIGVLAAIGVGLAAVAKRKSGEAAIQAQLNNLITAIESYRADYNQYPPDNAVAGRNVSPAVNPLYYELVGTLVERRSEYHTSDRAEKINSDLIKKVFNRGGFLNSVEPSQRPRNYLPNLKESQRAEIDARDIEVLRVPVDWPANVTNRPPLQGFTTERKYLQINPWQYVSTNPTNNPGQFDLWAEVIIGKQYRRIGNWKE